MECEQALELAEKLADGEASLTETAEVQAHLETCSTCRAHHAFVIQLSRRMVETPLAEPKQSYWDGFADRVLERVAADGPREVTPPRATPSLSSGWLALAASLLVATILGALVLRDGQGPDPSLTPESTVAEATPDDEPRRNAPQQASPGRVTEQAARPQPARDEALASAPGVRSDPMPPPEPEPTAELVAPAPIPAAELDRTAIRSESPGDAARSAPSVVAEAEEPGAEQLVTAADARSPEDVASKTTLAPAEVAGWQEERADAASEELSESVYQELLAGSTMSARAPSASNEAQAAPAAAARTRSVRGSSSSCEDWRGFLEAYSDSPRATDARYQLAHCSLELFRSDPTDLHRDAALRDGESFLARESDGPRAEVIRDALAAVRSER